MILQRARDDFRSRSRPAIDKNDNGLSLRSVTTARDIDCYPLYAAWVETISLPVQKGDGDRNADPEDAGSFASR